MGGGDLGRGMGESWAPWSWSLTSSMLPGHTTSSTDCMVASRAKAGETLAVAGEDPVCRGKEDLLWG